MRKNGIEPCRLARLRTADSGSANAGSNEPFSGKYAKAFTEKRKRTEYPARAIVRKLKGENMSIDFSPVEWEQNNWTEKDGSEHGCAVKGKNICPHF